MSSQNRRPAPQNIKATGGRLAAARYPHSLWPVIVQVWIALVIVLFLMLRIVAANIVLRFWQAL